MQRHTPWKPPQFTARLHFVHAAPSGYISLFETQVRPVSFSKTYNLFIVEDCAQAHGAEFRGKKAGSFGDISAFSFYPTKILGTFGDGGICITKSEELASKIKSLRFYGMKQTYFSHLPGYNSRLDEVHAAILRYKLKQLDNLIQKRKEIAKIYDKELLNTSLTLPHSL